ncbi:MAG: hypothetical protein GC161_13335 [Planctomycetaceae bacterium]|nr:hypothetical protein [Planctomycetaceae bacterium]
MDKSAPLEVEWRGTLPVDAALDSAEVRFAHTRTRILELCLVSDLGVDQFQIEGSIARVQLAVPIATRQEPLALTLRIRFEGEPPRPIAVWINGGKRVPLPPWLPAEYEPLETIPRAAAKRLWALERARVSVPAEMETHDPGPHPTPLSLRAAGPGPSEMEVFAERARAIERSALVRQAFLAHDEATNPRLHPAKWDQHMAHLNVVLGRRVEAYIEAGRTGKWPRYPALPAHLAQKVGFVTLEFQNAFAAVEAHNDPNRPIDLYDWAFEHFVTGAVATHHNDMEWQEILGSHGTPDSTYVLRYAALAIAAIESNVEAHFWRSRLSTLVRAAHIYLEIAAPLTEQPYRSLESEFRFNPDLHYPRARRRELRAEYAAIADPDPDVHFDNLRARFASLLGRALRMFNGPSPTVSTPDIPSALLATLRAQGVGAPYTGGP